MEYHLRLIRSKIINTDGFNKKYDKEVLLDEDNYLNYENWPYWDNNLISDTINQLPELCINIAKKSLFLLLPCHEITYDNVTVNEIETNIDYYMGCNNSLDFMKKFSEWIEKPNGNGFKKDICEIAVKHRCPVSDDIDRTTTKEKE